MASIFDSQLMSKADIERINRLGEEWRKTDDSEKRRQIHEQAEAIRQSYGYSGGDDGSNFLLNNQNVMNTAAASSGYTKALEEAEKNRQLDFLKRQEQETVDGAERLRRAYIKSMQDKLGLSQELKANGVSGGASESTFAALGSGYDTVRNSIDADTEKAKRELAQKAVESKYESGVKVADAEYAAANKRADRLTEADNTAYDRSLDSREWDYKLEQTEYQKQQDEYRKQQDALDREYAQRKDELDRKYAVEKDDKDRALDYSQLDASTRAKNVENTLRMIENGNYSSDFSTILGINDDDIRAAVEGKKNEDMKKLAWLMLEKGVFDESFPALLGYSRDTLMQYAQNAAAGL